jgi:hypothetical protein
MRDEGAVESGSVGPVVRDDGKAAFGQRCGKSGFSGSGIARDEETSAVAIQASTMQRSDPKRCAKNAD